MTTRMPTRDGTEPGHEPEFDPRPAGALQLYLLGPPRVVWHQKQRDIPRRQVRTVLYYLALSQGPVPTDRLCFLLWPDAPDRHARRNLSHVLTHLRRALPFPDVLEQTDSAVGLAPRDAWSDVSAFRQTIARARLGGDRSLLRNACALYRSPLLDGVSLPTAEFEHEVESERHELEGLLLSALRLLMDEEAARGNHDAVISYGRRYLSVDDLAEDVHALLFDLYEELGRRTEARRQAEWLAEILDGEAGVARRPTVVVPQQNVLATVLPWRPERREPDQPRSATGEPPLVGRDEALARISLVFRRVRRGRGGLLLVSGETGVGKTRLVREWTTRIGDEALVLAGSCYAGAESIAFQPLAQVWRQLTDLVATVGGDPGPGPAMQDPRPRSRWLSRTGHTQQIRALRADDPSFGPIMANLLLELASGSRTVVLCLDDLHWADQATLEWMAGLTPLIKDRRLLVLGTFCCKARGRLGDLVERWSVSDDFGGDLRLSGLDGGEILRLLRYMHGAVPGDALLAHRLHQETGGNPLYFLEGIRDAIGTRRGEGSSVAKLEGPVPDALWRAVMGRLSCLAPATRQTLEAAAQLGRSFTGEQVQGTSGLSTRQLATALVELDERRLLARASPGYRFQHNLIRRVVVRSLNQGPGYDPRRPDPCPGGAAKRRVASL